MKRKLFWGLIPAMCIAVLVLMTSCGRDGRPGNAYLGVWVEYTQADQINYMACSFLPNPYYYGRASNGVPYTPPTYYGQYAGSYSFAYQVRYLDIYSVWQYSGLHTGTLTISVEPGQAGGLLTDGRDGADRYFDWVVGWYGSTINFDRAQSSNVVAPASGEMPVSVIQGTNPVLTASLQPPDPALYDIGPVREVSKSHGGYRFAIKEYTYSPKGSTVALPKTGVPNPAN
jgi:hypothetical protein